MIRAVLTKPFAIDAGLLLLRVFTGALLIHHGYEKLANIENFADAFVRPEDAAYLRDRYGAEHVFALNMEQVYDMKANLFSISPEVVISDQSFSEVNAWLTGRGIQVETVDYSEISKQGGLFRCSTLPLQRS